MTAPKIVCIRCLSKPSVGPCCSSHDRYLCHGCYRITHFVQVCGCSACDAEGLPRIYPPEPEPAPPAAEVTIMVSFGDSYTKVSRKSGKWAASQPVAAAVVRCIAELAETRNDPVLERIATLGYTELKAATADQAEAEETTEATDAE